MRKKIPGTHLEVENIFCIGRNYSEHIKELKNVVPTEPVVFIKPTSSIIYSGDKLALPAQSARVDHEVEIVVALAKGGKNLTEAQAIESIAGIGVGVDFTARDLQDKAKEKGLPWSVCKGFDGFAAISTFVKAPKDAEALRNLHFTLEVNGEKRQTGNSADMLNSIPALICYLSTVYTLSSGDLIFTGTPQGVTPLKKGDHILSKLEDWTELKIEVV
jgi:2-keto-4-pentenoate hydratase/2-oxohepta-3-ene-1,7-dioic acid hydratase in catechol pathway